MKSIYLLLVCLCVNSLWSQETTTIYLIRHAEKAEGSADPGLSDQGKDRAAKWGSYFEDKNITNYYSTNYKRTTETMTAISAFMSKMPAVGSSKQFRAEGYDPNNLLLSEVAKKNAGKNILVVGHSNTIPAQVNKLIGENKYTDMQENEYGNLYIIKINGDKITHEMVKM